MNLITNIIGAATGVPEGGLRIGISIFLFLFWLPVSFMLFIYPYHIIMKDEGRPIIFYVVSAIATIWFFIWCIADFADANGFVMVGKNFGDGRAAAGVFGIVTALIMLIIALLNVVNMYMFFKR